MLLRSSDPNSSASSFCRPFVVVSYNVVLDRMSPSLKRSTRLYQRLERSVFLTEALEEVKLALKLALELHSGFREAYVRLTVDTGEDFSGLIGLEQ